MKRRIDIAKLLFCAVTVYVVLGVPFAFGLYSAHKQNAVYKTILAWTISAFGSVRITAEEASTLTKIRPKHFLQPARFEGHGVTRNIAPDGDEFIFMAGFFDGDNGLRLIKRDGTVIARWQVRFFDIFADASHATYPPETNWNVDTDGALILPDGSVVFNFEYAGLVKLDRCGQVVWSLAKSTHHSVETAEYGGFWVPGRQYLTEGTSPFPPFRTPFLADTIMHISDDGELLAEILVPELFYENHLEALLTATGESFWADWAEIQWDGEILHLNKIEELTSDIAEDFPMFEAGDLMLSLREHNLILVVDPDTRKIKWWKTGPWIRQHDPEFRPGGDIIVFNNNIFRNVWEHETEVTRPSVERVSNIIQVDPVSNDYNVIYGGKEGQEMLSVIRGKHEVTASGGLLITEFEGGRVFETDSAGRTVWEYVNRYDAENVAEITEARVYPASYFNVSDWDCT